MKKGLLIGVPLLLVLGTGTTVGLSMLGIVNVPFLPFGKKRPRVQPDDGRGGPMATTFMIVASAGRTLEAEVARTAKAVPSTAQTAAVNTEPGEKKLAGVWAEIPTDKLVAIVDKWPDPQLGRILMKMDEEALTKLLAALPPERAAKLSQAIAVATDESAIKVRET